MTTALTTNAAASIVRAPRWTPLTPGIRALFQHCAQYSPDLSSDEDEVAQYVITSELAAIEATHPWFGLSSGPHKLHVSWDGLWNAHRGIHVLQFGAYGCTHVLAFGSLEDALEDAAAVLKEVAPGCLTEPDYEDALKDAIEAGDYPEGTTLESLREADDYTVFEAAETDLTYTESGHIASWEWGCTELSSLDEITPYALNGNDSQIL